MAKKKKEFILENGIIVEAKSTRQVSKLVGDLLFFDAKLPVTPIFSTKISDVFINSKPRVKIKKEK